ncbi:MAG: thiamine phosphate synthase [Burkholderiales bacterium]
MNAQVSRPRTRGLYAVTPDVADTQALVAQVSAAIMGGTRFVQYRNKIATAGVRLEQAYALKSLCNKTGACLIINDHVELALAIDADGVHVGAEDTSVHEARRALGHEKVVGVSCYNELALALSAQASGADYVAFGSFFPSRIKPGAVHAPLDLLIDARRQLNVPIVAIGGITVENGASLVAAGASALAVISALFQAPDVTRAAQRFTTLFEAPR